MLVLTCMYVCVCMCMYVYLINIAHDHLLQTEVAKSLTCCGSFTTPQYEHTLWAAIVSYIKMRSNQMKAARKIRPYFIGNPTDKSLGSHYAHN